MKFVLPKITKNETNPECGVKETNKFVNPDGLPTIADVLHTCCFDILLGIGIRHLQSLLMASCVFCGYLQRVNLSVTILAMTKLKHKNDEEQNESFPVYDWNNDIRSNLHSAFFLGYLIMNFPAALLGVHFNNKILLSVTVAINGILSCLTPFLITFTYTGSNQLVRSIQEWAGIGNWKALVILRVLQGILQAFIFPTVHSISARWAPPNERSRLVGFVMSGIPLGTTVTLAGSGLLASNPHLGWPSVFYISGLLGIVWTLLWVWLGSSSPSSSRAISTQEYEYISSQLPPENSKSDRQVPWKDILTSMHVWAIVVVHTAHNWGFWLLLSEMPTFLNAVSGFDIKSDGMLSALPYLAMWFMQFPIMWVADRFNKRGITSITISRKLWTSIGQFGGAIGLVVLGYLNHNAKAAMILFTFVVAIGCCINVGFNLNHMDLTSNYAGILMGLSNGIASTGGFGAPQIVSFLVDDITSAGEWRNVFFVGAAILFFGNLFYIIFGSGKTQTWNNKRPSITP